MREVTTASAVSVSRQMRPQARVLPLAAHNVTQQLLQLQIPAQQMESPTCRPKLGWVRDATL